MSEHQKTALVLGAGGFIGSHMVKRLRSEGYWVRGVDIKNNEYHNYANFITKSIKFHLSFLILYDYPNQIYIFSFQN